MTSDRQGGDDSWLLWRDGAQYGPYSWEDMWRMGEDGNLLPDDLIWSAALGEWTPASAIPSLTTVTPADPQPAELTPPRRRSCLLPALVTLLVVAGAAAAAWYFVRRSATAIVDHYPKEGPAGSYVVVELSRPVDIARVGVRFGDTPLSVTGLGDRCLGVRIPLDPQDGPLRLFDGDRELDSVPFAVTRPKVTPLLRTTVAPAPNGKLVISDSGISVMVPGGLVREPRALSVSRVENAAVYRDNPFDPVDVIDVSIDGMEQLDGFVEIGVPYDPAKLDPSIPVDANFAPVRWDEKEKAWVDLYYRVDESKQTVYFVTDHLSAFWTGFSVVGLGKTAAIVGVVGGAIGEVAERWANDKYVSRNHKIRILYSDKALRKTFPDDQWKKAIAPADLYVIDQYDPKYSAAVQDIAHIFEQSLAKYVEAGFPDPTRKGIGGLHLYTRYVKVKVDSIYNYYIQQGEMAHETFWDTIHLPSEILKLEFFDPASGGRGSFEEHFSTFKALQAHELFHVIQRPYYGIMITFTGTPHKWWREATAEWAAHDLAKIPNRPGWDKDSPSIARRIGPKFLQSPINTTGKVPGTCSLVGGLDYEYLAPVFVRYLVDEKGFTFKELIDAVAKDPASDPLVPLRRLAVRESGGSFDDFYADFSAWLIRHAELPLSSFDEPKNASVAASVTSVISIDEQEITLRVHQAARAGVKPARIVLFRTEDGRERLTMHDTPLLVVDRALPEFHELRGSDGDILYFVAANGSDADATVGVTIQKLKGETWEDAAAETLKVAKGGTATIWAVKISSGGLEIEPDRIDDAKGYEKYEFKVSATALPADVTEVSFDYDFGDGRKDSKGTIKAKVEDRAAEITLERTYEPSPGLRKEDPPLEYVLEVDLSHAGKRLSRASAKVTVAKAEVVAMPRRLIAPAGETFEFEAAARPPGSYRFEWEWPGPGAPLRTEGASSKASFELSGSGDHPVTLKLFSADGVLLARDVVVATVDSDTSTEPPPAPTQEGTGRWVLTRQWSKTWTDERDPRSVENFGGGNGAASIKLSVPTAHLRGDHYETVMEPFAYAFSWTPLPGVVSRGAIQETRLSIDSASVPNRGYNWSTDLGLASGPIPEPGWVGHGAQWEGVSIYSGAPAAQRAETVKWGLGENPDPGDTTVVTIRVFGQGVNLKGAMAVYLYHEYTWQK